MPVAEATKCGAKKRQGSGVCTLDAGWGTDHVGYGRCKLHGGSTPQHIKGAAVEIAQARARKYAPSMTTPVSVTPLQALLNSIYITAGEVEYFTLMISESEDADDDPGVVVWASARRISVRDLAHFAKMALDAGVAQKQVDIAERVGVMMARVLQAVLDELALTQEQSVRAPEIVKRNLHLLAGAPA